MECDRRPGTLCHLWAGGILGLEVGALLLVGVRRLRPWFVLGVMSLHAVTWFLLGLDYWTWPAMVVIVLVDWDRWAPRIGRYAGGAFSPR